MQHLTFLLINLKGGLKHKKVKVRCKKTSLNLKFLSLLVSLGIVESFRTCLINKYKLQILINQPDLIQVDKIKDSNLVSMVNVPNYLLTMKSEFNINLFIHRKIYINYKGIMKLQKKNNKSIFILSTSKGFITIFEAIKHRVGGRLICQFCF